MQRLLPRQKMLSRYRVSLVALLISQCGAFLKNEFKDFEYDVFFVRDTIRTSNNRIPLTSDAGKISRVWPDPDANRGALEKYSALQHRVN